MSHRDRIPLVAAVAIALVAAGSEFVHPGQAATSASHQMPMNAAAMKQRADLWWATHRPVGGSTHRAAAVTIQTMNYQFDIDGNPSTIVDTAFIHVGDTVMWQWVDGFHTATNGTGSGDPQAGVLFNAPLDNTHQTFSYTFNSAGTYPFFCFVHEGTMVGYVVVSAAAGVDPGTAGRIGFTRGPSPNPTLRGASFTFTLLLPGRARAEVFDTHGRRVAVPLDLELGAGAHEGVWDGRRTDGRPAEAGVYFLRLSVPGYTGTRAISLAR